MNKTKARERASIKCQVSTFHSRGVTKSVNIATQVVNLFQFEPLHNFNSDDNA